MKSFYLFIFLNSLNCQNNNDFDTQVLRMLTLFYIFPFLIHTSFMGNSNHILGWLWGWRPYTPPESCACLLRGVCLHLSKSSVNWILLYVSDSGCKCKVACTELYVLLLWGPPALPHCSIKTRNDGSKSGREIINNTHGIQHPGRFCCKLTWQWGDEKGEKAPLDICLAAFFFTCGEEKVPDGEQLNAKCSFSLPTLMQAQTPWGKTSRNPRQIRRWHIKNCVTKKGSNVCNRYGGASSFSTGLFLSLPRLLGVVGVSEGNALSGLPSSSGIWSRRLCDSGDEG